MQGFLSFTLWIVFCLPLSLNAQDSYRLDARRQAEIDLITTFKLAQESGYSAKELNKVALLNSRVISNETSGNALRILAITSLAIGTSLILSTSNAEDAVLVQAIGVMTTGVGIVSYGVSIPLKLSAKKRRRERDLLISRIKDDLSVSKL